MVLNIMENFFNKSENTIEDKLEGKSEFEKYLSLEQLLSYMQNKEKDNNFFYLNKQYEKIINDLKLEDKDSSAYYDLIYSSLSFFSAFSNKRLTKEDIKQIKDSLPRFENLSNKDVILKQFIKTSLLEILEINEYLLKTIFFYHKKYGEVYNLNLDDLFLAYKTLKSEFSFDSVSESEVAKSVLEYYKEKYK